MTRTPKNALINNALRHECERGSGIRIPVYVTAAGSNPPIYCDWFGTYLGKFLQSKPGKGDLVIHTFEDLVALNEEDSKTYLEKYIASIHNRNSIPINHLLNFPANIKKHVSAKQLSSFCRRVIMATLIAKEIHLRATNPKSGVYRSEIHKKPINKSVIASLELYELVAHKEVTKDSPLYLREFVSSTHPSLCAKLEVGKPAKLSESPALFKQVYHNLSVLGISIELINQSTLLDEFFVIDCLSENTNKLSVGVNPVPVLQRFPKLNVLLSECKNIIEIAKGIPSDGLIKDTADLAEEDPNHDDLPSRAYKSTNPLIGYLINKFYKNSSYDESINAYFPDHLEYLAKLMREKKLRFEPGPRNSNHVECPHEYESYVSRSSSPRRSTSNNISMTIRINPEVENFLIILAYGFDGSMAAYRSLWDETLMRYLGSEENISLVIEALKSLNHFYSFMNSIEGMTRKLTDASLPVSGTAIGLDGKVHNMLISCKNKISKIDTSDAIEIDVGDMAAEYSVTHIGGFDFNLLH